MDKMYYYNYLRDYILEVGDRIIGLDKTLLEDSDALHIFLDARAQLAVKEFEQNRNCHSVCGQERAM